MAENDNNMSGRVGLDTTDFKNGVKELNGQIKAIETGFQAAAAVMGEWGNKSEGLNMRVESLTQKLDVQKQKLEIYRQEWEKVVATEGANSAAAQKLAGQMYSAERAIEATQGQLVRYSASLTEINSPTKGLSEELGALSRQAQVAESGFKAASSGINYWQKSAEGLKAKISSLNTVAETQQKKLEAMRSAYQKVIEAEGENSRSAQELAVRINNEQAALNGTEREIKQYTSDLDNLDKSSKKSGDSIKDGLGKAGNVAATGAKAAGAAIAGMGAATVAAGVGIFKLAESASDLNEAQNVVQQTYKKSSASILAWTNTTAQSAGIGKTAATQMVGTMGAMLKSSGMTEQAAGTTSKGLVQLTGDLSSFYNVSTSDMWEKMRAGMAGETKPLKDLGINMDVANLSAEAMSEGIKKPWKEMSQAQQTQVRYNYLLKVTKDAQGDFARTSGSMANQQRILTMQIQSLGQSIGAMALPMINSLIKSTNGIVASLNEAVTSGKGFDKLGDSIGTALNGIIGKITGILPGLTQTVTTVVSQLLSSILKILPTVLPALMKGVLDLLMGALQVLNDNAGKVTKAAMDTIMILVNGITKSLPQIIQTAVKVIISLVDGLVSALPKLIPAAVKIILELALELIKAIPQLVAEMPKIVDGIVKGIADAIPILIEYAPQIIIELVKALIAEIPMFLSLGPRMFNDLVDGFKKQDWGKIGKNILDGIFEGFKDLQKQVANFGNSFVSGLKSVLGIHSPSTVMRDQIGVNISKGIIEGIKTVDFMGELTKIIKNGSTDPTEAAKQVSALVSSNLTTVKSKANTDITGIKGNTDKSVANIKADEAKKLKDLNAQEEAAEKQHTETMRGLSAQRAQIESEYSGKIQAIRDKISNLGGKKENAAEVKELRAEIEALQKSEKSELSTVSTTDKYSASDAYEARKKAIKDEIAAVKDQATKEIAAAKDKSAKAIAARKDQEAKEIASIKKVGDAYEAALKKEAEDQKAALKKQKEQQEAFVSGVNDIESELVDALKQKYQQDEQNQEDHINTELSNLDNWKTQSENTINSVYKDKEDAIEAAATASENAIQAEINALDQQAAAEDRASTRKGYTDKIADTQSAIQYSHDDYNKAQLQKQLAQEQADYQTELNKEARDDQKAALQAQLDAVKSNADAQKQALEAEKQAQLDSITTVYNAKKKSLDDELTAVKNTYTEETKDANLQAEAEKLIIGKNQDEIIALLKTYGDQYKGTGKTLGDSLVAGFQPEVDQITSMIANINASIASAQAGAQAALQTAAQASAAAQSATNPAGTAGQTTSSTTTNNFTTNVYPTKKESTAEALESARLAGNRTIFSY